MKNSGQSSIDFNYCLSRTSPCDHDIDLAVHVSLWVSRGEPGSLGVGECVEIEEITVEEKGGNYYPQPVTFESLTESERDEIEAEARKQMKAPHYL